MLFSDGMATPLRDIDPNHYYLGVESLDSRVIAFAPVVGSRDPRVIAVGDGEGSLLKVSVELADECHHKTEEPLAADTAAVSVEIRPRSREAGKGVGGAGEGPKGKKQGRKSGKRNKKEWGFNSNTKSIDMGDLSEMLSNIALRDDDNSRAKYMEAGRYNNDQSHGLHGHSFQQEMTPLEVGMYILLGVFCVAIAVFMASCFVYASKHQKQPCRLERKSQSVQNAHDWVWLGRATLDTSSVQTSRSRDVLDNNGNSIGSGGKGPRGYGSRKVYGNFSDINITANPGAAADCLSYKSGHPGDVYAELPRKKMPRQQQHHGGGRDQMYPVAWGQQQPAAGMQVPISPYRQHTAVCGHPASPYPSTGSPASVRSRMAMTPVLGSPTTPGRAARQQPINSATYTRRKPAAVSAQHGILPVGYPLFGSNEMIHEEEAAAAAAAEDGPSRESPRRQEFHNPWEALHHHDHDRQFAGGGDGVAPPSGAYFEGSDHCPRTLQLDLPDNPPPYDEVSEKQDQYLRQSPASGLPPEPEDLIITTEQVRRPRGEYIPLNPDIDKPSPPRQGAQKLFPINPFEVTDDEAPPIPEEKLSPSHIFNSFPGTEEEEEGEEKVQDETGPAGDQSQPETELSEGDGEQQEEEEEEEQEEAASVCSPRAEMKDDLPDPKYIDFAKVRSEPAMPGSRRASPAAGQAPPDSIIMAGCDAAAAARLSSVAIGSLDYEQLMTYFEGLKESSA